MQVLVDKLHNINLPNSITEMISCMLCSTNVNVSFSENVGEEWRLQNSFRQGGIWSSLSFSFYNNECIEEISIMETGCGL